MEELTQLKDCFRHTLYIHETHTQELTGMDRHTNTFTCMLTHTNSKVLYKSTLCTTYVCDRLAHKDIVYANHIPSCMLLAKITRGQCCFIQRQAAGSLSLSCLPSQPLCLSLQLYTLVLSYHKLKAVSYSSDSLVYHPSPGNSLSSSSIIFFFFSILL